MSTNSNDEIEEKRDVLKDVLARRGIDTTDEVADGDDPAVTVDTLKAEYDLETLNKDTEIQSEIEDINRRIDALESRTPKHVEALRAKRDTLETLQGGWRFQDWGSVRREMEGGR